MKDYDYNEGCSLSELQADALRCIIDAIDDCEDENAKSEMVSCIPAAMHELNAAAQIEDIIGNDEDDCEEVCEALGYCPFCPSIDRDEDDCDEDEDFCCENCPLLNGDDDDDISEDSSDPEDK